MTTRKPAETPHLLEPRHCVMSHLHRTARVVSRIYAEEMRPAGLGRSQFTILNVLASVPGISVTALADRLAMERTTLARNLKPLERSAMIERRAEPADARQVLLVTTAAGKRKLKQARAYWRRAQQRLIREFGEERWVRLETELQALRGAAR